MVDFTVKTQQTVNDLLVKSAAEQTRLLAIVDQLKSVQERALESINNQEAELQAKKIFETNQAQAVTRIQELLGQIQDNEKLKEEAAKADKLA